jgi:hypothetical protein
MLAVMADSTKTHSKPSRKTSTVMSRTATVGLVCGVVGFGAPAAVAPCHINKPTTRTAATNRTTRNIHLPVNDMALRDGMSSAFTANDEVTVADGKTCFIFQFRKLTDHESLDMRRVAKI